MNFFSKINSRLMLLLFVVAPCKASLERYPAFVHQRSYMQMLTQQRIVTGLAIIGGIAIGGYALYRWRTLTVKKKLIASLPEAIQTAIDHSTLPSHLTTDEALKDYVEQQKKDIWKILEKAHNTTIGNKGPRITKYIEKHASDHNIPYIKTKKATTFTDLLIRYIYPKQATTLADHLAYWSYVEILPNDPEKYSLKGFFDAIQSNMKNFLDTNMNSEQIRFYNSIQMPHNEILTKLYAYIQNLADYCTDTAEQSVQVRQCIIQHIHKQNTQHHKADCSECTTAKTQFLESIRASLPRDT